MGGRIVVPVLASILILGGVGMVQQSFAGEEEDCTFWAFFSGFPLELDFSEHTNCPSGEFNEDFPIVVEYKPALPGAVVTPDSIVADQAVHFELPNFIDPFDTKTIEVLIVFDAFDNPPVISNIRPAGQDFDTCFRDSSETGPFDPGADFLFEQWTCHPNPDNERIWVDIGGADIITVEVHTVSFGKIVGGELLPIDNTALMLAGLQSSAIWMLPVLAGAAGIGAYYIKTRMNKE